VSSQKREGSQDGSQKPHELTYGNSDFGAAGPLVDPGDGDDEA
jgi:hypothetical protein